MTSALTPQDFVVKWRNASLKERSAAQEHFIDICRLAGHPTPAELDPSGQTFAFKAGAGKSQGLRRTLAKIWPATLALGCISFLIGLFIAITGYIPGVSDDERILAICWAFIFGGGLGMYLLTFVAGFASDIQKQIETSGSI